MSKQFKSWRIIELHRVEKKFFFAWCYGSRLDDADDFLSMLKMGNEL